ncbi:DUF3955 domain-containing protein (plasmid) [Bacillus mycoides]|uniref:DUF3955 domain-containing protein n=1 Tax=Bacillus cereus group TaxID=86661 RepID=UPI0007AB9F2C|nr:MULTISPECIES: DUF3955 domain-containing protein [Bacillus cereus group]KAA0774823.1 DUF3955 domain-containing protein [Bacillus sp. BB51/4]QWG36576.1 DUF3955 domain-containing protein [Bacillus mycoides]QWG47989.1 DUF3955 domain-containing protein [Bacillus mycoides]QWH15126.1 DUF3955 domain-containing protein [Bacillus mycoides]QWH86589.1 DUF3955 domain-containing protein [Bacillus mycoides]
MKKIYVLAFISILLGAICMVSYLVMGSSVEPNGTLTEPFFLIPLSILFVFSGITALLLVAIISVIKKVKNN